PEDAAARPAPEGAKTPVGPRRTPSLGQTGPRPAPWQHLPDPTPREVRTTDNQPEAPVQPPESVQGTWQLNDMVTRVKSSGTITAEGAKNIKQLLRELRKQGVAAVPAIRDF